MVRMDGSHAHFHAGTYNDIGGNQFNNTTNVYNTDAADTLVQAVVTSAMHDSRARYPPHKCFPGTRREIMKEVTAWMKAKSSDGPGIYWLHGLVGVGKSSVSQSLAEKYAEDHSLGATFFFSRGDQERCTHKALFNTIAYQLSLMFPSVKRYHQNYLKQNPTIVQKSPRDQLRALILKPFSPPESYIMATPKIVIIDSIHECMDEAVILDIIQLLVDAVKNPWLPLRFLITSQYHAAINDCLKEAQRAAVGVVIKNLYQINANEDIRLFLQSKLQKLAQDCRLDQGWPSDDQLNHLVMLCARLFIYAFTIVKYIEGNRRNPQRRLNAILRIEHDDRAGIYATLDNIYKAILSEIPPQDYKDVTGRVIAAVIFASIPLTLDALDDLLQLQPREAWRTMQDLNALFVVPDPDNDPKDDTVQLAHTIFIDFITDNGRSAQFFIQPSVEHGKLTRLCLALMAKHLQRNICRIPNPRLLNREVADPPLVQRRQDHICRALQYACCHWIDHLGRTASYDELLIDLGKFARESVLHWIEVLSILGAMNVIDPVNGRIWEVLERLQVQLPDLKRLLETSGKFTAELYVLIQQHALYVYGIPEDDPDPSPAPETQDPSQPNTGDDIDTPPTTGTEIPLPSAPAPQPASDPPQPSTDDTTRPATNNNPPVPPRPSTNTALESFYSKLSSVNGGDITRYITVQHRLSDVQFGGIYSGALTNLPTALQSYRPTPGIAIQVFRVPSSLESPGKQGERWKKVKENFAIWRTLKDQNIIRVLGIARLTISNNDEDEDDLASGFPQISVITPWMPNGKIMSYVESNPDKPKIPLLVGIAQGLSRLHNNPRRSIIHGCLTPENILIDEQGNPLLTNFGLGPLMEDAALWATATMRGGMGIKYTAPELLQSRHREYSMLADVYAYGLTSFEIMTERQPFADFTNDQAVWAAVLFENKRPTRPLDGSISERLWREWCSCWDQDAQKRPSSRQVYNAMVKFAESSNTPRNTVLASGSDDKTVRLWDVQNGLPINSLEVPHSVYSLSISPKEFRIATASVNDDKVEKSLTMLNADDQTTEWSGIGCSVVAFSPDGRQLASSSRDHNVVLWKPGTGVRQKVFAKHDKRITSIVFSPKGDKIVTGSLDKSVRIWSVASGQEERKLITGTSYVDCVAWSSDERTIGATFRPNVIRLWDLNTGKMSKVEMPAMMLCIAFSPTQPLIATGSNEGRLHFWDVKTGQESGHPLQNHSEAITSLAFNGDGSLLATASNDKTVRVSRMDAREEIHAFTEHSDKVKCVAFVLTQD